MSATGDWPSLSESAIRALADELKQYPTATHAQVVYTGNEEAVALAVGQAIPLAKWPEPYIMGQPYNLSIGIQIGCSKDRGAAAESLRDFFEQTLHRFDKPAAPIRESLRGALFGRKAR